MLFFCIQTMRAMPNTNSYHSTRPIVNHHHQPLRPWSRNMEILQIFVSQTWRSCWGRRTSCPLHVVRFITSLPTQRVEVEKCWQVSSYGRVWNTRGKIPYGSLKPSGYCRVQVLGNDVYVHRLVALAFLGPPPDEATWQVHHLDGNPSNNRLHNLGYVTQSQNILASFASFSRRCGGAQRSVPVVWRVVGSQSWTTSPSMTHAAAQLGISLSSVSRGCHQGKAVKGYEFQSAVETGRLEGEEWRQMYDPFSGLEVPGRMVSSLGRIRSQRGRLSWGYLHPTGYYMTSTSLMSTVRHQRVHRLVAYAFLGRPESKTCNFVNHKDLDKRNNAADNLEYVTCSENMAHFYANTSNRKSVNGRPVESSLKSQTVWTKHPSIRNAASDLGINRQSIYDCINGKRANACGYEFRLADPPPEIFPGEEWRRVDVAALRQEKDIRKGK